MMNGELNFTYAYSYIITACILGFSFGIYNWRKVNSIKTDGKYDELEEGRKHIEEEQIKIMNEMVEKIEKVNKYYKI